MKENIKLTLRTNVLALLKERGGPLKANEAGVTRLINLGFTQGTAQRILGADTSLGLDLVQQLAEKLVLAPWQLLVPGLDPKAPQGLTADPMAWPFAMVQRRAYFDLPEADRNFVQGALAQAISDRAKVIAPEKQGTSTRGASRPKKERAPSPHS